MGKAERRLKRARMPKNQKKAKGEMARGIELPKLRPLGQPPPMTARPPLRTDVEIEDPT